MRARIAAAEAAAGREPGSAALVAVAKTHPAEAARAAIDAGQRAFAENRVQEARAKWPALREAAPGVALHLIGPLQTNKARDAVALFDAIETVDRPKLAAALAREMDRAGRRPACLVEVNTGVEAQKAGIHPSDADDFIAACRTVWGLPVEGLMCIPVEAGRRRAGAALRAARRDRAGATGSRGSAWG